MGRWPRRRFLGLCGAAAALPLLPGRALADTPTGKPLHGLSAFGDLKYGPNFTHFDYASPDAPSGGTFNFSPPNWAYNQNVDTFNTLNTFVPNSDAPPRMEVCFDSLMVRALDEPDALYGLLAESVTISPDRNSYDFKLRPEAKFSDGSPLTAEDVAYTYRLFKEKGHPSLLLPLREAVDFIAHEHSYIDRKYWRDDFPVIFYVHRSFSAVILLTNLWLVWKLHRSPARQNLFYRTGLALVSVIGIAILAGITLDRLGFPAAAQPVHLLMANVIFGLQFFLYIGLGYAGKTPLALGESGEIRPDSPTMTG